MRSGSFVLTLILAAAFSVAACGGGGARGRTARGAAARTLNTLNAGDEVEILVYEDSTLNGKYTIAHDGTIDFPLVGNIRVADRTPPQIAELLRTSLIEGRILVAANVRVNVSQSNSARISVLGAVAHPGSFPLTPGLTAMQAISLAGGFDALAEANNTEVTRRSGGLFAVRVSSILRGEEQDPALEPGDIVQVPRRPF